MRNTWFEDTFLQSLVDAKGAGKCYLSEKQAEIFQKYSKAISGQKASYTMYGTSTRWEYIYHGREFTLYTRGKYFVLYIGSNSSEHDARWVQLKIEELTNSPKRTALKVEKFRSEVNLLIELIAEEEEDGGDITNLKQQLENCYAVLAHF